MIVFLIPVRPGVSIVGIKGFVAVGGRQMKCEWVFLRTDGSKEVVVLDEKVMPVPGDGKWHSGVGYTLRHLIEGRTTAPYPAAIATENP